jgi:hypothetical protein
MFTAPPPADGWQTTFERATAGRDRLWLVTLRADPSAPVVVEHLLETFSLASHQVRQKVAIYQLIRRK